MNSPILYLINGEDVSFKKEEISKIEKKLFSSQTQKEFNYAVFDAKETEAQEIVKTAKILPWQTSRRLIIVRNIEYFKPTQQTALISYLKQPFPQTILILTSDKIDKRNRLYQTICKFGKVISISKSKANDVFELTAAVGKKDEKKALNILDELLREGKKAHEILGLLFWQINRIYKGKKILKQGAREKLTSELNINPAYIHNFIECTNKFSLSELKKDINLFAEADLQIKTMIVKPKMILEILIIKLCSCFLPDEIADV